MSGKRLFLLFQRHQWLVAVCVFVACLTYFVFVTGWYEPARLVIKGRALTTDEVVTAQWNSGAGYNAYEQEQFRFLSTRGDATRKHSVVLSKIPNKNVLSLGKRIVLFEIRNDDRGLPIPGNALKAVQKKAGSGWLFESDESEIRLNVTAKERLHFFFKSDDHSGIVRISIDGQDIQHDLYRSNWAVVFSKLDFWLLDKDRNFTVSFDMPRYEVESLRIAISSKTVISSLSLQINSKQISIPFSRQDNGTLLLENPTRFQKYFFHPTQFFFQFLFALFFSWVFMISGKKLAGYGSCKNVFFNNERWLFWAFSVGAGIVYSLWLLAFWPGVMSVDSLNIWRAAVLPEVMINDHPVLNEIWYMFFQQLWNNIVIVPIAQIVLLSVLIGATFFIVFRQGVKLWLLLPCYLLLVMSVPIGLYSITLWKDVPFALLVVFWSLTSAYLFLLKKKNQQNSLSLQQIFLLFLLFLGLLLFRHNGMVYVIAIPLLFIFTKLVVIPRPIAIVCGIVAAGVLLLVVFPPKTLKSASYFHDLSVTYLQQIQKESLTKRITKAAEEYPRLLDLEKNKKESDFWHFYLGDRYAYTFLKNAGWNDVHKYLPPNKYISPILHDFGLFLYNKSLKRPWIYLTWNPFFLLYLFPLSILLCRWFPLSSVFSVVVLVQIGALLVFVGTTNWRYYYFVLMGGYFLLPVILLDWSFRVSKKQMVVS